MSRIRLFSILLALKLAAAAYGQTLVDLKTQGKSIDFSASSSTRPVKTGTALPASCAVGELFFKSNAPAGQNLYACHTANSWSMTAASTLTGQLRDLTVSRSSATLLSVGDSCTASTPCNVRIGNVTHAISIRGEITLQNGTGTALIYISSLGALTVGHNLTLTCDAGCTAVSGVTAFPSDSVPLASWTSLNGVWDNDNGLDWRAFQSSRNFATGTGLTLVEAPGNTTISVDPALVGIRVPPPASASTACLSGAWAADADFFYVCHAADTWKRSALSTW